MFFDYDFYIIKRRNAYNIKEKKEKVLISLLKKKLHQNMTELRNSKFLFRNSLYIIIKPTGSFGSPISPREFLTLPIYQALMP